MSENHQTRASRKLPCQFFIMGTCQHAKGEDCKFSHDRNLCKPGALAEPCKHFLSKGFCRNGRFCLNVHDQDAVDQKQKEKLERAYHGHAKVATPKIIMHSEIKPPVGSEAGGSSDDTLKDDANNRTMTQAEYHAQLEQRDEDMYFYGDLSAAEKEHHLPASSAKFKTGPSPDWADLAQREVIATKDQPSGFVTSSKVPCRFFMRGECHFGNKCRYSHPAPATQVTELEAVMDQFERQTSSELECGICLETIVENNDGRFGILTGCDHAFCLSCIKNWRSSEVSKGDNRKELVRRCPLCREPSFFVVPCDRMVRDPARKNALIEDYQRGMKKIPCRYFDQGKATCPFGTSCFYRHVYANGQEENPGDLRIYKDAEGRTKVDNSAKLAAYFDSALSMAQHR
mmetsp:Transcript_8511/g.16902  ORF Transcript_8511/g.16902 Transcript_8511/m.16902 type:complete len:400 (-) Transcript_8511:66-1265(-)|eukprot:CAMPEP_0171525500 /NCGR_PEP_ID=MMETSP0959-20130129/9763_1 /TAXON_ID=87120 /ORGANISM="Aurantiochytrium limacinum, Strain ATCCMYA-1381" /LENGTH=399 /DNA_ID=CAMNT_0012066601 /DNA_START=154 /DNA_END=1353 /DNA_ORIENTATION=-